MLDQADNDEYNKYVAWWRTAVERLDSMLEDSQFEGEKKSYSLMNVLYTAMFGLEVA